MNSSNTLLGGGRSRLIRVSDLCHPFLTGGMFRVESCLTALPPPLISIAVILASPVVRPAAVQAR